MCGSLWLSRLGDSGRDSCAAMKRPSTLLKKPASKTAQKLAQKKPASPSTRVSNGRSFVVRKTKALPAAVVSGEESSSGQARSGEKVAAAELLAAGYEGEASPGEANSPLREGTSVKSDLSSLRSSSNLEALLDAAYGRASEEGDSAAKAASAVASAVEAGGSRKQLVN